MVKKDSDKKRDRRSSEPPSGGIDIPTAVAIGILGSGGSSSDRSHADTGGHSGHTGSDSGAGSGSGGE